MTLTPYSRLVAATDGSKLGRIVLTGARQLAARTGAELYAIHVAGDMAGHAAATLQVDEVLRDFPHSFTIKNLIAGTAMTPSKVIAEFADQLGDAAVIVGTRGRGGIGTALLGSTTAELLTRPGRTTIVYGPRAEPPTEVSRVVCCVDGTSFSELSVDEAARWAAALKVNLLIVQVVPPDLGSYVEVFESTYIQNLSKGLAELGSGVETEILHAPSPADAIGDSYGSDPTSLSVLATHGRVGLTRLTMGSVSSEVVRTARGPVALLHPDSGTPSTG
jgi:nucleotide-binding universal stress UspA family protein